MNSQKLLAMVGGVVVLVGVAYFVLAPYAKNTEDAEYAAYSAAQKQRVTEGVFAPSFTDEPAPSPTEAQIQTEVVKQESVPAPTTVPTPDPKPTETQKPVEVPKPAVSGFTMTEVALHNSATSCWSVVSGSVYDLTSYVPKHPGGERNILKICGKDGTAAFSGQHGGDSKPEATLAKHRIGALIE